MGLMMGRPMMAAGDGSQGLMGGAPQELYPHRIRVVVLCWFQAVFGLLGTVAGLVISFIRLLIGVCGIYASWPPCERKGIWLLTFAISNAALFALDGLFLVLVLGGDFGWLKGLIHYIGSTQGFEKLGDNLDALVDNIHKNDGNGFIFSLVLDLAFLGLAAVWTLRLYTEIQHRNAVTLPTRRYDSTSSSRPNFPGSGHRLGTQT
mmetsp:Transcript_8323/g.25022  ORF Transcript_8323/g.25022 Transcript_8323/m.25022 type:complete len:205 (-) Transcript_8323:252-866(-)